MPSNNANIQWYYYSIYRTWMSIHSSKILQFDTENNTIKRRHVSERCNACGGDVSRLWGIALETYKHSNWKFQICVGHWHSDASWPVETKYKKLEHEWTTKANHRASLILKAFLSREPNLLFKAFTVYVRPLLEY